MIFMITSSLFETFRRVLFNLIKILEVITYLFQTYRLFVIMLKEIYQIMINYVS